MEIREEYDRYFKEIWMNNANCFTVQWVQFYIRGKPVYLNRQFDTMIEAKEYFDKIKLGG